MNSNVEWSVSIAEGSEWMGIDTKAGSGEQSIQITVDENKSENLRSGIIEVLWETPDDVTQKAIITVEQKKRSKEEDIKPTPPLPDPSSPGLSFTVSPTKITFSDLGGNQTITVKSNTNWKATVRDSWMTISSKEGNGNSIISLKATVNDNEKPRHTLLTFTWIDDQGKEKTAAVNISQKGTPTSPVSYLQATPTIITFSAIGGSKNISISSNTNWEVITTGGDGWLTINNTRGNKNKNITIKAAKNEMTDSRSATLTINWNDEKGTVKSKKVSVSQTGNKPTPINEAELPTPITKNEVQVAIGKTNDRIPRNCTVIVNNGESIPYWNFCRGMNMNAYSSVVVTDVSTDASGKASVIKVSAKINEDNIE